MSINKSFINAIVSEIEYAVKEMKSSKNPEEKLYYFSAVHGIIKRVLNLEYDSSLVYMHVILNETYQAFLQRIGSAKRGDIVVNLTIDQFDKLEELTNELGLIIKSKKPVDDVMKKFAILSYSTSGNGYYLMRKGLLVI